MVIQSSTFSYWRSLHLSFSFPAFTAKRLTVHLQFMSKQQQQQQQHLPDSVYLKPSLKFFGIKKFKQAPLLDLWDGDSFREQTSIETNVHFHDNRKLFTGDRKCYERKPSEEDEVATTEWYEHSVIHLIMSYSTSRSGICVKSEFTGRVGGRVSGRPCLSCSKKQQQKTGTDLYCFHLVQALENDSDSWTGVGGVELN